LTLVGYKNISINDQDNTVKLLNKGMSIDLGGIAKGFAADEVEKIFKDYGIQRAVINLGDSTIYTMGNKPGGDLWAIAISNPRSTENTPYLGVINIPQMALSTSGDYERYFIQDGKRYHHILSPFTGYPADAGVMSDTILIDSNVENCNMLADICTKIVFINGVDKGFQIIDRMQGVSCMAVTTDYQVHKSANWSVPINNLDSEYHE
jgi:thiamine biosynthesis lipoprotein